MVVCSYYFSVDRQDASGPTLTRDGMRTPVPADIADEQSLVLAAIAETIDHPLLRGGLWKRLYAQTDASSSVGMTTKMTSAFWAARSTNESDTPA